MLVLVILASILCFLLVSPGPGSLCCSCVAVGGASAAVNQSLAAQSPEPGHICEPCPTPSPKTCPGTISSHAMSLETGRLDIAFVSPPGMTGSRLVLCWSRAAGGRHALSLHTLPGDLLLFSHRFQIISDFLGADTLQTRCAAAPGWRGGRSQLHHCTLSVSTVAEVRSMLSDCSAADTWKQAH